MSYYSGRRNVEYLPPRGKDFWGPPIWTVIHILAIILELGKGRYYKEFLLTLTHLLPCDYCKVNLMEKLKNYPPDKYLSNGEKAFLYSYIIHDLANQHISKLYPDKPKESPPFEEVKNSYLYALNSQGSKFWGPPVWAMIHILAATLRHENSHEYKKMLETLTYLLPCPTARNTLKKILEKYPIDPYLRNNNDAFFYSYMVHDLVNRSIGKISPPYEEVKSFYFNSLGEECRDCKV